MFQLTKHGLLDSRHVRAMFQNNRRTGVHYLKYGISSKTTGSPYLPEMQCFGAEGCTCLAYETGTRNEAEPKSNGGFTKCLAQNTHTWSTDNNSWFSTYRPLSASRITVMKCWEHDDRPCLITQYKKSVRLGPCWDIDNSTTKSKPGMAYNWLHELNPDSYKIKDKGTVNPPGFQFGTCKDPTFWSYYRAYQSGTCTRSLGRRELTMDWQFSENTRLWMHWCHAGHDMRAPDSLGPGE
ncbi:hypothetical protein QBC38DRAFT_443169 [Podospora fimiseda]|uniref:Uncharacterized protein n=1 Tax=Podospora fimiseda TaxID=252190 RepID=A0AAN7BR94_9PEZI|nr:hypothetical protein QBC38DRAFT_443169 [Podospora fimiseda]